MENKNNNESKYDNKNIYMDFFEYKKDDLINLYKDNYKMNGTGALFCELFDNRNKVRLKYILKNYQFSRQNC